VDPFQVIAAPARRRILTELRRSASSVNRLAQTLAVNQPAISKHLKVLREAGFVSVRGSAQQRIYRLEPRPFKALEAWLDPYRRFWNRHLDALERHLDDTQGEAERGAPCASGASPARKGRRKARARERRASAH
jgi:DNA-binding transcriptional ArsR family regulator